MSGLFDRILKLHEDEDKEYLLKNLDKAEHDFQEEEVRRAVNVLVKYLDEEWTTIYSGGLVGVDTGEDSSRGFYFFRDIVPVGLDLAELENLDGFKEFPRKLSAPSEEKRNTITEIRAAANFRRAGCEIELEPEGEDGTLCEFKTLYEGNWIYFECKRESLRQTNEFNKAETHLGFIGGKIVGDMGRMLEDSDMYRTDALLYEPARGNIRESLMESLEAIIEDRKFGQWYEFEKGKVRIVERSVTLDPPSGFLVYKEAKVGSEPTKLSEENSKVQLCMDPFGEKEIERIERLLGDANKFPSGSGGVILLELTHPKRAIDIVEEKLAQDNFSDVLGVILTGRGSYWVPNPDQNLLSARFGEIAQGSFN